MKILSPLIILTLLLVACGSKNEASPTEGVSECFYSYKTAILSQDGEAAVSQLSQGTIDEYQKYIDLALTAKREDIESLSFMNRMQVLFMRHRVPVETLKSLDGRTSLIYAVDRDWIGKNGVIRTTIGHVDSSDGRATAEVLIGGEETTARFQFIKEDSGWKFDLRAILIASNIQMKDAAERVGKTENEFIFMLAESVSGKAVDDSIWSPPMD